MVGDWSVGHAEGPVTAAGIGNNGLAIDDTNYTAKLSGTSPPQHFPPAKAINEHLPKLPIQHGPTAATFLSRIATSNDLHPRYLSSFPSSPQFPEY